MKKIILSIILLSLIFFINPVAIKAADTGGLVPCGAGSPTMKDGNGNTVPNPSWKGCEIGDFFVMLSRIFNFAIKWIVAPLAILMLTIGGILILISAGNPGLAGKGKQTLYMAIIGIALAFGAWIIINFILGAIGYIGNWSTL